MSKGDKWPRRPGMLRRWFYRVPVFLYRMGLGGLVPRQALLTTIGRKSGRPRHAVVEVMKHDAATDTYYVSSSYGVHSDWYRNLQANPALRLRVRGRRFPGRATVLPREEGEQFLFDCWQRERSYYQVAFRLMGLKITTDQEARAAITEMRVVAIQPEAA